MATEEGLSTGKTILIGAIVLGCFAVLWPKIFAPMLFEGQAELPRKSGKSLIKLNGKNICSLFNIFEYVSNSSN